MSGEADAVGELLGPSDPPPYEVLNPRGRARVLLVCDHANRTIPHVLDGLGLSERDRHRHIAWDIGAGAVTRRLSCELDAPAVLAGYSRLVIDCNRYPNDPSVIREISDSTSVPGNQGLDEGHRRARLECIWRPYHLAVRRELERFEGRGVVPVMLSIHSFTPVLFGRSRPWHIGLLWDTDSRIAVPLMRNLAAGGDIDVGDNKPYSGRHPEDYTIDHHAERRGIPHASIEIRQDLIDSENGARTWSCLLASALRGILADEGLYSILA